MDNEINIELYKHPPKFKERIITDKEKDYAYYSEALHSSYLFYTMEVDRLNKQLLAEQAKNKKLIEALESVQNNLDNILLPDYEEDYGNYNTFYQQTSSVITQALNEINK